MGVLPPTKESTVGINGTYGGNISINGGSASINGRIPWCPRSCTPSSCCARAPPHATSAHA
eukprot:17377-Rhodomonas_salina.1